MAKGPAGVVIPAASVLVWFGATRRWGELSHVGLGTGPLVVALVVGPWFVAALVRHGVAFTDELIFHDMFSRAFNKVHDTNVGADTSFVYYVQQLGYGLFPWTVLVPFGLLGSGRWSRPKASAPDSSNPQRDEAVVLLIVWFAVTFALFAMIRTKFHHYILPAVPPAATLAGLALDSFWTSVESPERQANILLGAQAIVGALLVPLVARDLVSAAPGGRVEGPARLMWLFTYRYDRPWPTSLDLTTPIAAAACVAALLLIGLVVPRLRRMAAAGWVALAISWTAWMLDVYLPAASVHWGQRAILAAYYARRVGPAEPIVAYEMNWKGENFYTGNRIAQFGVPNPPAGTPTLAGWVHEQHEKGTNVMYFVTEQGRVAGLRRDLQPKELQEVTTPADCNQFVLVRAEL
jgi:4-amino-4-deoxy-L-arabinose transferase-like glycosyltransferase